MGGIIQIQLSNFGIQPINLFHLVTVVEWFRAVVVVPSKLRRVAMEMMLGVSGCCSMPWSSTDLVRAGSSTSWSAWSDPWSGHCTPWPIHSLRACFWGECRSQTWKHCTAHQCTHPGWRCCPCAWGHPGMGQGWKAWGGGRITYNWLDPLFRIWAVAAYEGGAQVPLLCTFYISQPEASKVLVRNVVNLAKTEGRVGLTWLKIMSLTLLMNMVVVATCHCIGGLSQGVVPAGAWAGNRATVRAEHSGNLDLQT